MKRTHSPLLEPLESRIAPAGIISLTPDHKTATWTDADGDKVTLKISKGELAEGLFTTDQSPSTGLLVTSLDLTNPIFKGTSFTLTASRDPLAGGDGTVNFGYLNAAGQPLGNVVINGDLGRIDAGEPNIGAKTPKAINLLSVQSMGMLGGATLPGGVTQNSEVVGKIGTIKVRGSVEGILFNVTGGDAGSIGALTIGGSLIGTDDADSGRFSTSGAIGAITLKGSIFGGGGQHSGSIEAGGSIKSLKIGGSIFGGRSDTPSTDGTGVVRTEKSIGSVLITGSIHGGTQQDSGLLSAAGDIGAVKILGGIVGGSAGTSNGGIFVGGNAKSISVKGDLLGGAALDSGVIHVAGKSGAVSLLGGLTGGSGTGSGLVQLGTDAADTAGSLSIARDVTGGSGEGTGSISVAGALKSLKIAGSVHGAAGEESGLVELRAGVGSALVAGDIAGGTGANSGSVKLGGVVNALTVGGNILGGTADGTGSVTSNATIAKLTINGSVIGGNLADSATSDLNGSGLVQAGRIGTLTIGGSIRVGEDYSPAHKLVNSAAIRVANDLASLIIKGGIDGTTETAALITARGQTTIQLDQTTDVAIGSIKIAGAVRNASILAGYDTTADVTLAEANPNAQIGSLAITGDWIASNLVAGAAWNDNFGNGNDIKAAGVDNPDIIARIASISVGGQVLGTGGTAGDQFGFIAQEIATMKIGTPANTILLNLGAGNDNDPTSLRYNLSGTRDVRVFEFA